MKKLLLLLLVLCAFQVQARQIVDVTVASNGCPAAVPDDGLDDLSAIQCQIDYMETNYNGGILQFPSGVYEVSATVLVTGAETLSGMSPYTTTIRTLNGADVLAVEFSGTHNTFGGLDKIRILCSQSTSATKSCVHVKHNTPVVMKDFHIWGGLHALQQDGVDGYHENGIVAGMARGGSNLYSRGANWYHRVKFNPYAGQTVTYAYVQNPWAQTPNNGVQENHFSQCDFSGNFDYAVGIYDAGASQAVTTFEGSVFSAPVYIWAARATIFDSAEFGSATLYNASPISITGSYSFPSLGVFGPGYRSCAGNINVTC